MFWNDSYYFRASFGKFINSQWCPNSFQDFYTSPRADVINRLRHLDWMLQVTLQFLIRVHHLLWHRLVFNKVLFANTQKLICLFTANPFQALTAANTSCYVPSVPAATGALPGATATTAYSTSSSSGRGSGGSNASNYHQSLPRHFLRANSNPGTGQPLPHSAAHSVGLPTCSRPTTTTTTTGRLITSSGTRGLPYSVGISHPSQGTTTRPHPQPIRTVSYYSTLSAAQNGVPANGRISSAGVYPDVGHDVMQPPRQFDSYYYHPATLNHSQTSVPLYAGGPYRPRQNESSLQATTARAMTAKKTLPGPGAQYNDLIARTQSTNGRPRSTNGPGNGGGTGASTEYGAIKLKSASEIDV